MTYEQALQICKVNSLKPQEQAAYEAILAVLSTASDVAPFNLFPLVMHFVSDGMASQLAQAPAPAREGRLVEVLDEIATILRSLVMAKCVVAGTLEAEGA